MKKIIFIQILIILIVPGIFALDIYKEIIQPGQSLVGTSYKVGGITPSGFDCSGFITYLYKNYVPGLPRVSRNMADFGEPVRRNSIIPGDLVFFATGSSPGSITHVAIYIGQNSIIHSISNGPNRGVTITSLSARYWQSRYHSAVRIVSNSGTTGSSSVSTASTNTDKKSFVENVQFSRGIYSGEVVNGEPEGKGTLLMNNGDIYEGTFSAGTFEGKGTYYWADGTSHTGKFHEGSIVDVVADEGENYLLKKDSPWETWDGIVEGDFQLWLKQDKDAFEEWKKNN